MVGNYISAKRGAKGTRPGVGKTLGTLEKSQIQEHTLSTREGSILEWTKTRRCVNRWGGSEFENLSVQFWVSTT